MHTNYDITIDSITKVEGNAQLKVTVENGNVIDLKFIIGDYRRFYTEAVKGKLYLGVPAYLSRICGTCSIAHQIASIEAVEKALGVYSKISEQTKILRKLAMNGMMIRDHALHLYIFCLPDVFGIDSVLDIVDDDKEKHQLLHDGFDLKALGNKLSTVIAGAPVHSPSPTIGGFLRLPDQSQFPALIAELETSREKILRGIRVFCKWNEKLERNTDYIALVNNDYNFNDGFILTSNGARFWEEEFYKLLTEVVVPYSQSEGYLLEGSNEDYLVGALARMNLNRDHLNSRTKESSAEYLKIFPSNNIFHNCLAQAIEILHCIDNSIDILKILKIQPEAPLKGNVQAGIGIGVIEAPRGTLYHKVELNDQGQVVSADVIVPTSQNQINIENDLKRFFQESIEKLTEEQLRVEAEKIIRAYDPCMSCSTNFLKLVIKNSK
jgi:coenzyme F420-reducing hydrogenase alpha subunit